MAEPSPDTKPSHPEIDAATHHDRTPNGHKETHGRNDDINEKTSTNEVKSPNVFERIKEEIQAMTHHDRTPHHHEETHGRSDDIDENTPIDEVKGPNVFQRFKEEVEALAQAITPKKESN